MSNCVIFGGKGYIGSNFAAFLLERHLYSTIFLADITEIKRDIWPNIVKEAVKDGRVILVESDVRREINSDLFPRSCELICNFAAIHREPGHEDHEYFETNIHGAEHICTWAETVNCNNIIFTSSIAPYGISDHQKTEDTLTMPVTPYGTSKSIAEKIHVAWKNKDEQNRYLSIVRPGVIYGPGEDGNVPRMIRAVHKGYFFYMDNQNVKKAGGYIKELVNALYWVLENQHATNNHLALYNFSHPVSPTIQEYVESIIKIGSFRKKVWNFPFLLLLVASYFIDFFAKVFGIKHPFSPVRIRKLVRPNDIVPKYLIDHNYEFLFDLESSFEDWKKESPSDWLSSEKAETKK